MNNFILLIGSNINPEKNIEAATEMLDNIVARSQLWKTRSFGSDGPDFLNMAVEIRSLFDELTFKKNVINSIEQELKRVRTKDKYAPRTIDIDIMIAGDDVVDQDIWEKAFAAIPVSELRPNLEHPTGQKLIDIAEKLKSSANAELFDINSDF